MTRPSPARIAIATLIGAVVVLPATAATAVMLEPPPTKVFMLTPVVDESAEVEPASS